MKVRSAAVGAMVAIVCASQQAGAFTPMVPQRMVSTGSSQASSILTSTSASFRLGSTPTADEETQTASTPTSTPLLTKAVSSGSEQPKEPFKNTGLMSWLLPYLDMMGLQEGKTVKYGFLMEDGDPSKAVSPEETARLRQEAARNLQNIGPEERQRRSEAGTKATYVAAAYAFVTAITDTDFATRFLVVLPLFFAAGYRDSSRTGL
mmetsp:Transcript_1575/g.4293  ORF Transcript_1575/g.4293 Transcript_1575/m.4293 type:complete len:206 (-) Transcript_1575:585-1202(-)